MDTIPIITKPDRTSKGQFVKGWKGGPGRPRNSLRTRLQRTANPRDANDVLARAREAALAGDIQACRLFLEYTLGRPQTRPAATSKIELPELDSSSGCAAALAIILRAATAGEISIDAAATLSELVSRFQETLVIRDLEGRLAELEFYRQRQ